jgi:hypothetical protein
MESGINLKMTRPAGMAAAKILTILAGLSLALSGCLSVSPISSPVPPAAPPPSSISSSITPTPPPPDATPVLTSSPTPISHELKPTGTQLELVQYALGLVNLDRQAAKLAPVTLDYNAAAQKHADDMLANFYLSHWGTDGLLPYMRFTLEGGVNYESENSSYNGWFDRTQTPSNYVEIDPKKVLRSLEDEMMLNDAASNWGHRDNILNSWHKQVNIGIAYDKYRLALVQQFEGNCVEFSQPPQIVQNVLSLRVRIIQQPLEAIAMYYDELPHPRTPTELLAGPHSYSLGAMAGIVLPPPPPGQFYSKLPAGAVLASSWKAGEDGAFEIQADCTPVLSKGKGVYTVVIWNKSGPEAKALTNFSIFLR